MIIVTYYFASNPSHSVDKENENVAYYMTRRILMDYNHVNFSLIAVSLRGQRDISDVMHTVLLGYMVT